MKRPIVILLLVCSISTSFAQINLSKRWSYSFWVGPVFFLSPENLSNFLPNGLALNNRLVYMIDKNIGIVPFDLAYARWNVDQANLNYQLLMSPGFDPSFLLFDTEVSFYDITYAPGLLVIGGSNKIRGFGQLGLGVAHQKLAMTVREPTTGIKIGFGDSHNDFTMQFSGGVEAKVTNSMSISGMTRYAIIIRSKTAQYVGFWGGLKTSF